jgi:hypothetical protein
MPQVERVSGVGEECGKKSVKHGHKKSLARYPCKALIIAVV